MIFAITTLISALSISLIAAYFSIIGLATIFPGSMYAVIAMGSVLEVGKIIASIWLHRNWKTAPRLIKFYLFSAILVLMGITSMGIFGFLSKSHIEHEQTAEKSRAMVAQVENKIERQKDYINRQKSLIEERQEKSENLGDKTADNIGLEQEKIKQLTEQLSRDISIDNEIIQNLNSRLSILDKELNDIKNKSGGLFSSKKKDIELKVESQKKERESISEKINAAELRISKHREDTSNIISKIRDRIQEYQSLGFEKPGDSSSKIEIFNQNISNALSQIDNLEQEKFNYGDGTRQLEAEIGPIKYVAEFISDLTGASFDISKAVRIVILILIFVFDPLAILLVLAAHISLSRRFPKAIIDQATQMQKTAEAQIKEKEIESKELELSERQKDINEEEKILELREGQIKTFKEEISKNKEVVRKAKIEAEKYRIQMETNSPIQKQINELSKERLKQEKELKLIENKKSHILCRIDKFNEDCREIKSVFTKHDKNKEKVNSLMKSLNETLILVDSLKENLSTLEKENNKLKNESLGQENLISEIDKLKSEKDKIKEEHSRCMDLGGQIQALKNQRDELIKNKTSELQKTVILKTNLGNGQFSIKVSSEIGGVHQFTKVGDFSKPEVLNCQAISSEIDEICPERKGPLLLKVFQANIKKYLDSRLDNRQYKKSRPEYKFIP